MEQKLSKLTTLFLLFAIALASSCYPEECDSQTINHQTEISFKEYSLFGTQCLWENLSYNGKVIIINSNEELEKYIACVKGSYPAIDFSKHTLLLVTGKINGSISEVAAKRLQKLSSNKFKLDIEINRYDPGMATGQWSNALIVEKLSSRSSVELNITLREAEIIYPIEIPFEGYFLIGNSCRWANLGYYSRHGDLTIINSNEEMENHIICTSGSYPAIDFSEYTLLLTYGFISSGPASLTSTTFIKNGANKYTLNLTIFSGPVMFPIWHFAFLVPKITNEATVAFYANIIF